MAGKVTVGLASHWPCVTDSVFYPPTISTPPPHSSRGTTPFYPDSKPSRSYRQLLVQPAAAMDTDCFLAERTATSPCQDCKIHTGLRDISPAAPVANRQTDRHHTLTHTPDSLNKQLLTTLQIITSVQFVLNHNLVSTTDNHSLQQIPYSTLPCHPLISTNTCREKLTFICILQTFYQVCS